MSRTYKKISPKAKIENREEWQVDEKGLKTAEQKRQAHQENKKDRKQAKLAANEKHDSLDFQQHHSASSRYTRAFIGE